MRPIKTYLKNIERSASIAKHFPENLDRPVELWPQKRVALYQEDAIKEILAHTYRNNSFYRKKWDQESVSPDTFQSIKDIAKFPFTFKDELRGKPWILLSVPKEEVSQIHMSTGTTSKSLGDHTYTLYSWEDIYVNELAIELPLLVHCLPEDCVINALPYEMSSAGMAFHRSFQNGSGAAVVNVGKGGFYSDPKKTLLVMKDLEASVLITTPSYAMSLWETAQRLRLDIQNDFQLKYIWLTGEGCSPAFRKRLEKVWQRPCLMYYGSLECGPLGIECRFQEGYHIPEGHVLVEIVDPETGKPLPPGCVGEICVTVLYRKAAPLIRYRVGDLAYLDTETCTCCIERPRLFLSGREQDQIKIGDKSYSPYFLEEILYRIPEMGNTYQFLVSPDGLSVRLELMHEYSETEKRQIATKIKNQLMHYVPDILDVSIEANMERTFGKAERVRVIS